MQIEYELTKQDYIDFNIYHAKTSDTVKKSLLFQRFILPILFPIFPFLNSNKTHFIFWFTTFIIIAVIWIVYYPTYFMKTIKKRVSKMVDEGKNKDILGKHIVIIDENELIEKTQNGENKISWSGIEKIVLTQNHIFVYLSAISACLIPNRAFESDCKRESFIEYINKCKNDFKG